MTLSQPRNLLNAQIIKSVGITSRKGLLLSLLLTALCVPQAQGAGSPQANKKPVATPSAKADKPAAPSEFQLQTWGPTECSPIHPGSLPKERMKSVKFIYYLVPISEDAPPKIADAQPYYLLPDATNPVRLYAGQELIIEIAYKLTTAAEGDNPEDALENAQLMMESQIPLISIDIGSAAATAINPAPPRGTAGPGALSLEGSKKKLIDTMYACGYKRPLIGDTIPTVSVTALVKDVEGPLTLLQTSLPQVHTLSYFNIATGLIASTIHDRSFNRVEAVPASGSTPAQFKTVSQNDDPRVMPVLFFTAYLYRPIDAEVPFEGRDLLPQPSVGFSLTSPSGDFFFGGSSEFFKRNVQLVCGYHYGQTTHLVPGQIDDPLSKDAPQTTKRFDGGAFVGLTFNIDFIKGLFSGGGSK
jgi:hypothetical protein